MQLNKNPLRSEFVLEAKVAHLYKKLEEIERDKVELSKLHDRIASDRDYSEELKKTFQFEIEKMESQRKELLQISVESKSKGTSSVPPESSTSIVSENESTSPEKKKTDKPPRKY